MSDLVREEWEHYWADYLALDQAEANARDIPVWESFKAGWGALADLLGNEHYAVYTEDGWTTEHSLECRLGGDMAHCLLHEAAGRAADPGVLTGRYRIAGVAENGHAMLEPVT